MAMINSYTKAGVLRPHQIETTDFDLFIPVKGPSVADLRQVGRSEGLNPARFWPVYVLASDLTP